MRRIAESCTCEWARDHDTGQTSRIWCDPCRKIKFETAASYCRCGQVVTNAAFFKKTSPHFNGTCRHWGAPTNWMKEFENVAQSWKKPFKPSIPPTDYRNGSYMLKGESRPWSEMDLEKFQAYWGIGDSSKVIVFSASWHNWAAAHWITVKFAGDKCIKCGIEIKPKERALYNPDTRQLACTAELCGGLGAKERWGKAA